MGGATSKSLSEHRVKREQTISRNHNFPQRASGYVVSVAAHLDLLRQKWILANPQHLLGNVVIDVAKRVKLQMRRIPPGLGREPPAKLFIGNRHQPALGVLNHRNRTRS